MATIGSITIAFGADLKGLSDGIDKSIELFDRLKSQLTSVSQQVSSLSRQSIEIKATADTAEIAEARTQVEALAESSPVVEVRAETDKAERGFSRVSAAANAFSSVVTNRVESGLDGVSGAASEVSDAVGQSSSAISGVSQALSATTTGFTSAERAIDRVIVAAGRSRDAYLSLGAAAVSASGLFGGFSTIAAAAAGSTVAAAISVASFAAAAAGAAVATGTFASIMALTRLATAGLSDEARRYVETTVAVTAAGVSMRAGLLASRAAYTLVRNAILTSTSASQFFTQVFGGVGAAAVAAGSRMSGLSRILGTVSSAFRLVAAAGNEKISLAGYAALTANVIATTAAFGAAGGAITAFTAGQGLMSGAVLGASSALTGLISAFPVVAALATAAAVATGRFYDQLKSIAGGIESTEQLAERFGATTQEMERLKMAAEFSGVSLTMLSRSQQSFFSNLAKVKVGQLDSAPVREAKIAFDKLGISMSDLKSNDPRQVFADVAAKLTAVKDPAERTAIAMDLLGQRGAMILPALKEFGELAADFDRLGGALSDIDFERFSTLEASFDRTEAASKSLGRTLLIPFTELQRAFNNFSADVSGGLSKAFAPMASMLADVTKPLAALIEAFGRMINVLLRIVGVVASFAQFFQIFASLAAIAKGFGEGFRAALKPLEDLVNMFTRASGESSAFKIFADAVAATLNAVGIALGIVAGLVANLVIGLTVAAAGWGIYTAAVALASGVSLTAAASFAVAWAAALGPIAIGVGVLALFGAGVAALGAGIIEVGNYFVRFGQSIGLIGESKKEIDGATASVEELAAAAEESSKPQRQRAAEQLSEATAGGSTVQVDFGGERTAQGSFEGSRNAAAQFGMSMDVTSGLVTAALRAIGVESQDVSNKISQLSAAYAESFKGPSREEITQGIQAARDEMGQLVIESARFGEAGADVAATATTEFNKLQTQLGKGKITLQEFRDRSGELTDNLRENLDAMKNNAPEITLKKNLELYKQLDDAVKQAGKSVRDIAAGTVIDGKLFPASQTVKANAEQYKNEYAAALDAIKKKLQSGGFADELKVEREQLQSDFDSGKISKDEFTTRKLELDTTSAQERAAIAGEEAKREFDRQFKKLGEDVSFADNIRKELETAFLSPVQKFEDELKKIKENPALTDMEKSLAETNLRKQARENVVGKSAQTQLQERSRDVRQAAESGLIGTDEMNAELKKAAEEFAAAVGVTKTPFETFSSSLDSIAKQFGFAGQPIDVVREKLKGNAEQLALFDRAVKESRDNLLASLGIEKTPQQVFDEQMKKIDEAVNATDPNKRITQEQAAQARAVATRKRDEALGAGADVAGQFRERQAKIDEAFGANGEKDPARFAAAQNKLAMDKRQAAGLDATPTQQLKAGVDKINDAFGVTGKSMAEIRASLTPEEFKEYQEALKKNSEAVKAGLGVEKSGAAKIAESREKLSKAVKDGVITEDEKNKALKEQRDSLLSSLGIPKTPAQDFEDAVAKIKENAAELSPEEIAKGLKEAKDKLLSSLGIDKSPAEQAAESMKKLREAFDKGQISADEFAKGSQKAKDTLLQSLGIPLNPVTQLRERLNDLNEAFNNGLISQEEFTRGQDEAKRSMLPGGEEESPVKKFQRDMKAIEQAASEGLIDEGELAQRRANLQAKLQEDLAPALDSTKADRRGIEGSDVRSKGGVDTFFRILRGNDNPSLKAQLEVAKNTRILAEAAREKDAAPVIAQLGGWR